MLEIRDAALKEYNRLRVNTDMNDATWQIIRTLWFIAMEFKTGKIHRKQPVEDGDDPILIE